MGERAAHPTPDISYRVKRISLWIPRQILAVARAATAKHKKRNNIMVGIVGKSKKKTTDCTDFTDQVDGQMRDARRTQGHKNVRP